MSVEGASQDGRFVDMAPFDGEDFTLVPFGGHYWSLLLTCKVPEHDVAITATR